jgi:hypothetical protein
MNLSVQQRLVIEARASKLKHVGFVTSGASFASASSGSASGHPRIMISFAGGADAEVAGVSRCRRSRHSATTVTRTTNWPSSVECGRGWPLPSGHCGYFGVNLRRTETAV